MATPANLLIVEGKDDFHVMLALRKKLQLEGNYEVVDKGSVDELLKSIEAELFVSGRRCLGIIMDKDTDDPDINKDRWKQIEGVLRPMGYDVPKTASTNGTVLPSPELGFAKVGIWLMPDNQNSGMLEDFIRQLIVPNDDCLPFAEETLQKLESEGLERYKPLHRSKALIHTWLAWQEDPGKPLGLAITKRYLTTDSALCQQFADWLNRLFK